MQCRRSFGTVLRFQECDDLPALLRGKLRPAGHSLVEVACGNEPEQLARGSLLGFRTGQGWRRTHPLQFIAVALPAILGVELLASGRGLGIASVRIFRLLSRRGR